MVEVKLKITEATVILNTGTDKVMLKTELPSSFVCYPHLPLNLTFDATYDMGANYVRTHFGIEPKIINTRY